VVHERHRAELLVVMARTRRSRGGLSGGRFTAFIVETMAGVEVVRRMRVHGAEAIETG